MINIEQEKLEIKEFLLDANLYLINNSFNMLILFGLFQYYTLYILYVNKFVQSPIFIAATAYFFLTLLFSLLGYRSIQQQKRYIERFSSLYEESV